MFNPQVFVDDLHHGGEAIRCAAGRGDNLVPRWLVTVMVHTKYNISRITIFDRSRDDDLFYAGLKKRRELSFGFVSTGAVDHHVNAFKREVCNIACPDKRNAIAID